MVKFDSIFPAKKPIIGMIHLAGMSREGKVGQAIRELHLYDQEGLDGAIIEDYHGSKNAVLETLELSSGLGLKLVRGVNLLHDRESAFEYADRFGAKFVQWDNIQTPHIDVNRYNTLRKQFPNVAMLGGVRFKYQPLTGYTLERDLGEAIPHCEAVVTTGEGTGKETPIDKLQAFKFNLRGHPLIVGAGVTAENVRDQLTIADGAIVGSYFKPDGNTELPVKRELVRNFMDIVRDIRRNG